MLVRELREALKKGEYKKRFSTTVRAGDEMSSFGSFHRPSETKERTQERDIFAKTEKKPVLNHGNT